MSEHETVRIARALRYDLTAMQAKVSELLLALGRLSLADDRESYPCPDCGIDIDGPRALAEHIYHVHGGPEPSHWA